MLFGLGTSMGIKGSRWPAADSVHAAFPLLPGFSDDGECHPERLPEGPPVLTICRRHLAAVHAVRRKTTPADLAS